MEKLIGRFGYKKTGFFSGLVGIIEENPEGISPYILRFKDGGGVGFVRRDDVVLLKEDGKQ